MPETLRLFFAVPLDDDTRAAVIATKDSLQQAAGHGPIKWVEDENLHLTLKFIGDAAAALVPQLAEVAAEVAGRQAAFDLALRGTGAFPNARAPRVIWLGAAEGKDCLAKLAGDLDASLAQRALVPKDDRPFATHLTLGRVKAPVRLPQLQVAIEEARDAQIAKLHCDHFVLMRSELSRQGPTYTELQRFDLREDR